MTEASIRRPEYKDKAANAKEIVMDTNRQEGASRLASPWMQLVFGVICMAMIANMQHGWTLFVNPINEKHPGAARPFK
ncbi:MAG: oxalate/formate antiporter [uncultured Caballeronia sp.]|nr:MAG: oxalate/formate antiporter [uncultured Caballeronia sp.]